MLCYLTATKLKHSLIDREADFVKVNSCDPKVTLLKIKYLVQVTT